MKQNCYFDHNPSVDQLFACYDGENKVCARCCFESCAVETPDWFYECLKAGHPTWPVIAHYLGVPNKLVCLEAYWDDQLFVQKTVKPFFDAMNQLMRFPLLIAHRYVESAKGLKYYTQYPDGLLWKDPFSWNTPLFYMAFHGRPGTIGTILDKIGPNLLCDAFQKYGGYDTMVYFGSCSVFKGEKGREFASDFLKASGVRAIIGYDRDVDWIQSMIIDLLFIQKFYNHPDPWNHLDKIHREICSEYSPTSQIGYKLFEK